MTRPWRITESLAAALGAALMLLGRQVTLAQASSVLQTNWNVFGFFLGLMVISAIADSAGFFDWAAVRAADTCRGQPRRLFINIFLIGTLISTFLSNDATALLLTPVVYTLVTRLRLSPMPYLFACTFIADTASLAIPVSNPVNIILVDTVRVNLLQYLSYMLLPAILAVTINLGAFLLIFKGFFQIPLDLSLLPPLDEIIPHLGFFHFVRFSLVGIALAYLGMSLLRGPLSLVALAGATWLSLGALRLRQFRWRTVAHGISTSIFVFIAGMLLVVQGIENAGVTTQLGYWLISLANHDPGRAVFFNVFGTAIGSNMINNIPMTLVVSSTLRSLGPQLTPAMQNAILYSSILGADLGPNITVVGSLATILWIVILRRRGLEISPLEYLRLGLAVTPWMILAWAGAIWLRVH
ncbi:MAG: arsenic transporter [Chloroflexi bacterium]|nr:arsenic transporter [Chloroflexota bacterium]